MTTKRSKTLSKTDLITWQNEAIARAFERNVSTADIGHGFDMTQHQVQRLQKQWYEHGNIAPVPKPGRPRTNGRINAARTFQEKVARNPVRTAADLSRESHISRRTGGRVLKDLGLRSRACQRRQKLTRADKLKRLERGSRLLRRLHDGVGPRIFLDEARFELNPYFNSTKDRVMEARAGDAGNAGINKCRWTQGLMVLGVFLSDGRSWLHIFQQGQTVTARTFIAAMCRFFHWLGGGIDPNSLLLMDGASAHTANATQAAMSRLMNGVRGALLAKND